MVQVTAIFVTGASSTGKTTLCLALEKRLKAAGIPVFHVSEVARTVMKEQGFNRELVATLAMQRAILRAQIEAETVSLQKIARLFDSLGPGVEGTPATVVLLCDRCAIDPVVYATMKLDAGLVSSLTSEQPFRDAVARYGGLSPTAYQSSQPVILRPIVVLVTGVKEWQGHDDGVRNLDDPFEVTEYFRQTLEKWNIGYEEIGENIKNIDRRVDWVLDIAGLNG